MEQDDSMSDTKASRSSWKPRDPLNIADNVKEEVKKPLTFKLGKISKLKTDLQGSVVKAFVNPKDLKTKDIKKFKSDPLKLDLLCKGCDKEPEEIYEEEEKLSYIEPSWGGRPNDDYKIKVLEAGKIISKLDLSMKNYHVIGESQSTDIVLSHETISTFHAILQYRGIDNDEHEKGMYIYDLNSEYGTFVNSNRIKPFVYTIVHNSDVIHFGNYPKKYILQTFEDIEEEGAKFSDEELDEREIELRRQREAKGINWGIDEFNENSSSNDDLENGDNNDDEELFINDPKKALRDWFKWEGYDLEFQTKDKGFGKFSCRIDLTLNPFSGETEIIEVDVIGDKMKAIDECALEACKFLNENGLLRQAIEEKKSISKNWEDVDYYDSDEDKYLDRTGIIERKRQYRMQMTGKKNSKNESLLEEQSRIENRIQELEKLLALQKTEDKKEDKEENSDDDSLDSYMSKLNTSNLSKIDVRNIKTELHNLYREKNEVNHSVMLNK